MERHHLRPSLIWAIRLFPVALIFMIGTASLVSQDRTEVRDAIRIAFDAAMKRAVPTAVLVSDEPAGANEGWSRLAWEYGDDVVRVRFGVAETSETAALAHRRYAMSLPVGTSPIPKLADEAFIVGSTNSPTIYVHFRRGRVNVEVSAPADRIVLCPFEDRGLPNCEPTAPRPALNLPPLPWQGPHTFVLAETAIRFAVVFDNELKALSASR